MKNVEIKDSHILLPNALIKLGKKEYMANYIDYGELRFAPAAEFSRMKEGCDKIADKYEGSLFYSASDLYAAPVLVDDENEYKCGKPFKITDYANLSITDSYIQHIPFHCLYCYKNPAMNAIVRLENYNQICKDFPEYDTAVIIYNPPAFLDKLKEKYEIYANYVQYTDETPVEDEIINQIHFLYYKRLEYKEQNEFRIALPKLQIDKPEIYKFGTLLDIAYCLPLKCLNHGVIIANNDADFQYLKEHCIKSGFGVGESSNFVDTRKTL